MAYCVTVRAGGVRERSGHGREGTLPHGGRTTPPRVVYRPGIQPADVQELIDNGATVIVLGVGMEQCLGVPQETLDALGGRTVHIAETREAVARYNSLIAATPVGGLFHSTC